jgi:hypothetical protein
MPGATGRGAQRHGREKGAAPGSGDISDAAPRWLGPARLANVDYTPKTGKAAPGSGGRTSRRCSAHGLGALGERQTRGLILCGARQRDVRRQRGRPRNAFGLRGVPRAARLLAGSTTSSRRAVVSGIVCWLIVLRDCRLVLRIKQMIHRHLLSTPQPVYAAPGAAESSDWI